MKKYKKKTHHYSVHRERPIRWLPIDSRFITPIFSFGSVKGIARLFLEIEITFALFIVFGTLIIAGIKIITMVTQ